MSDSNYMTPKQRDYTIRFSMGASSMVTPVEYEALDDSHDVADSVMRELAEALRDWAPKGNGDEWGDVPAIKALARFDALGGNDE
jgi:hypothetical protein